MFLRVYAGSYSQYNAGHNSMYVCTVPSNFNIITTIPCCCYTISIGIDIMPFYENSMNILCTIDGQYIHLTLHHKCKTGFGHHGPTFC